MMAASILNAPVLVYPLCLAVQQSCPKRIWQQYYEEDPRQED